MWGRDGVEEVPMRGIDGGGGGRGVGVEEDIVLASSMLQAIKEGRISCATDVEGGSGRSNRNKDKKVC